MNIDKKGSNDDKDLRGLFEEFNPEISPDYVFLNRLKDRLDSFEMIHQHNVKLACKRQRAVALAGFVGFLAGFFLALCLPCLDSAIAGLKSTITTGSIAYIIADNYLPAAWLIIFATSTLLSYNTYELSMSLQNLKK